MITRPVAARLPGEPEHLAEAQTGPLTDILGGEEQLEDALQIVSGNADAGVGQRYGDQLARARTVAPDRWHLRIAAQPDRHRALAIHRVARVDRQVDQRRLELADVGAGTADHLGHLEANRHARAGYAVEHVGDGIEPLSHLEHLGFQRLAAREGKELAGQLGRSIGGVADRVETALAALGRHIVPAQQVHRAADHGQQVVEAVRDPAGELADRLHLLALAERVLSSLQFLPPAHLGGDVESMVEAADDPPVAHPGRYPAILCFSTNPGDILDDSVSTPRGLAVKIIGVEGDPLPGSEGVVRQDLVKLMGHVSFSRCHDT